MKYIKIILLAVFLATTIFKFSGWKESSSTTVEAPTTWQNVLSYAQENLPLEGQLAADRDGFTYLKVDDRYIHDLYPMLGLRDNGFREPPYFRTKNSPGAHITVFYSDEHVSPAEVGKTFHFKLKDIEIVSSKNGSFAVLQVEAPELESLRQKYGLRGKIHGHEFHITLAKKRI